MQADLAIAEQKANQRYDAVLQSHQEEKQQVITYRSQVAQDRALFVQQVDSTCDSVQNAQHHCAQLSESYQNTSHKLCELIQCHQQVLAKGKVHQFPQQDQTTPANQQVCAAIQQKVLLIEANEEREATNETIIKQLEAQLALAKV